MEILACMRLSFEDDIMDPSHIPEAQEMYDEGHTFYAIASQMKNWYTVLYTKEDIAKALKVEDNPIGHPKFR